MATPTAGSRAARGLRAARFRSGPTGAGPEMSSSPDAAAVRPEGNYALRPGPASGDVAFPALLSPNPKGRWRGFCQGHSAGFEPKSLFGP